MELLEYQAKELFRQMGIPVLPSQRINQPRDLKALTIPYPVVLKSQVYTGGRGKAGGIKFVSNTIDAMAAAQAIFHLPIMGKYPDVLLAEARYDADREFYLAIVLDSSTRRPLLLGSQYGGEEVESKLDQMQQVIVDQEFSPFYARRLATKMGLHGNLIQSVSALIEKMYALFVQKDLDLIEINPLAVSSIGELMALDGKVIVNDAALGRQIDVMNLFPNLVQKTSYSVSCCHSLPPSLPVLSSGVTLVERKGNIGVLCNGAGLAMATLDLLHKAKGKPMGFVDLGGESRYGWSFVTLQERIEQGLERLSSHEGLEVILINILGNMVSCLQVAEAIAKAVTQSRSTTSVLPLVVKLVGDEFAQAYELLATLDIPVFDRLDDAIAHTILLAKSSKR